VSTMDTGDTGSRHPAISLDWVVLDTPPVPDSSLGYRLAAIPHAYSQHTPSIFMPCNTKDNVVAKKSHDVNRSSPLLESSSYCGVASQEFPFVLFPDLLLLYCHCQSVHVTSSYWDSCLRSAHTLCKSGTGP
jgi:hypothetical protein